MKAFFALVAFEIRERKAILAAAAVASLLPLLAPLLPSTGSNPAADIREAVMWVVLGGLAPLFALLLGISFIGRDLAEGRMGFFYAQPLSGPTIWFAKLTAVVVLVWSVELIIMLPTVLLAPDPTRFFLGPEAVDPFMPKWLAPMVFWVASVAVVLLAHAIGVVWRARSAWLVIDLIAVLIVAGAGWLALSPFLPIVAPEVAATGLFILTAAGLGGLVAGGAVQLSKGRVDLRRCHRALSATLWTVLGAGSIAVLGWSVWIRSATVEDLRTAFGILVGSGDWIAVEGVSDGRMDFHPRFLLNVKDGRSLAIGAAVNWRGLDLVLSADGARAVWAEYSAIDRWPLMTADLGASDPVSAFTGVELGMDWEDFAVSPDGARVAILEDRTVAVYRIDPPEQVMAAHIDGEFDPFQLRFDDSNSVRVLASASWKGSAEDHRWRLFFLDIEARRLVESAAFDTPWRWGSRTVEGRYGDNLDRIERNDGRHFVIRNPESGEVAADLGLAFHWFGLWIRRDGRIVVVRDRDDDHHIGVYSPGGSLIDRIELPAADEIHHGGEVEPDRFLVGLVTWEGELPHRTSRLETCLVDLTTGRAETILAGYAPVLGRWGWWGGFPGAWDPGAVAGRLVHGEDGSLRLWDPETNKLRQLIPAPD
jgi:hypothetical protein